MKVAVIHGQQHKGNTYKLTHMLLNKLNCDKNDISEFYVNGIKQCKGCLQCILKDENLCAHREDIFPIIDAIDKSDVIIFESPNYCMGMTGQLKSFFDHFAYRWMSHRPVDMRNKIGIAISTTAGVGAKKTTKAISEQLIWWSVGKTYQLPFTVSAFTMEEVKDNKKRKLEKRVAKLAATVNKKYGHVKPCFKTRFFFAIMKFSHKKMPWNEVETNYWKSQGWIK